MREKLKEEVEKMKSRFSGFRPGLLVLQVSLTNALHSENCCPEHTVKVLNPLWFLVSIVGPAQLRLKPERQTGTEPAVFAAAALLLTNTLS